MTQRRATSYAYNMHQPFNSTLCIVCSVGPGGNETTPEVNNIDFEISKKKQYFNCFLCLKFLKQFLLTNDISHLIAYIEDRGVKKNKITINFKMALMTLTFAIKHNC